jgi:hypothetical protein
MLFEYFRNHLNGKRKLPQTISSIISFIDDPIYADTTQHQN